jgi:hypothetical protein
VRIIALNSVRETQADGSSPSVAVMSADDVALVTTVALRYHTAGSVASALGSSHAAGHLLLPEQLAAAAAANPQLATDRWAVVGGGLINCGNTPQHFSLQDPSSTRCQLLCPELDDLVGSYDFIDVTSSSSSLHTSSTGQPVGCKSKHHSICAVMKHARVICHAQAGGRGHGGFCRVHRLSSHGGQELITYAATGQGVDGG